MRIALALTAAILFAPSLADAQVSASGQSNVVVVAPSGVQASAANAVLVMQPQVLQVSAANAVLVMAPATATSGYLLMREPLTHW